ncbi:MAG: septum formation initiator family protein [Polyangia bacterium]
MRRGTKTWASRVAAATLVIFVLGYVPYHVYARSGLARTLQLRRDLAVVRARNADLRGDNERLAREAEALRTDPEAIERVARAELGWVRPGEVIVDLSRPALSPAGSATGSEKPPGRGRQ